MISGILNSNSTENSSFLRLRIVSARTYLSCIDRRDGAQGIYYDYKNTQTVPYDTKWYRSLNCRTCIACVPVAPAMPENNQMILVVRTELPVDFMSNTKNTMRLRFLHVH